MNKIKEYGLLFSKGFIMGAADVVPGVSGGTIAFITGIYDKLISAINSINLKAVKLLFTGHIREAFAAVHLSFLIPLGAGVFISILSFARTVTWLIEKHPVHVWAFFFGLIVASTIIVIRHMGKLTLKTGISFLAGAVAAWYIVGIIPVKTPETWWFTIFAGAIAIIAMILPGISGSFILVLLSQYERIMTAVKNLELTTMILFSTGSALGILSFSRILGWLLEKHRAVTMALLGGFMAGSLRKVWPYKNVIETKIIEGKQLDIKTENIMPQQFDSSVLFALLLVLSGIIIVFGIEYISHRIQGDANENTGR